MPHHSRSWTEKDKPRKLQAPTAPA